MCSYSYDAAACDPTVGRILCNNTQNRYTFCIYSYLMKKKPLGRYYTQLSMTTSHLKNSTRDLTAICIFFVPSSYIPIPCYSIPAYRLYTYYIYVFCTFSRIHTTITGYQHLFSVNNNRLPNKSPDFFFSDDNATATQAYCICRHTSALVPFLSRCWNAASAAASQRGVCGQDVGNSLLLLSSFVLRILSSWSVSDDVYYTFSLRSLLITITIYTRQSADKRIYTRYNNARIQYTYYYYIIVLVRCLCALIICYYLLPIRAVAISRNLISKHA